MRCDPRLASAWVDEEHRLLFRGIQKSARSVFKQLFHKLAGDDAYDALPYHKPGLVTLGALPAERSARILEDPAWHRAVVLRDPFERLVSAFLHLLHEPVRIRGRFHIRAPLSFAEFLDVITEGSDEIRLSNLHWRPQVQFFPTIDVFNYVIDFTRLPEQGRVLLQRVGAWEAHGRTGWGPGRDEPFLASVHGIYSTRARERLAEFAAFEPRVRELYRADCELLERAEFGGRQGAPGPTAL